MIQTAQRVSDIDVTDNFVFQRSALVYAETSKVVGGDCLEIGTGMGYGIKYIAPKVDSFVTVDKNIVLQNNIPPNTEVIKMKMPDLSKFNDNSFDFVVSFQVIEHIKNDNLMLQEICRVLKKGGKFIVSTPNKKMSLSRNPWYIREYTVNEFDKLLSKYFINIEKRGIFGNDKILKYYEENKKAVAKFKKLDIFNLENNLPRFLFKIPYDMLNRLNRKKLLEKDNLQTKDIKMTDYFVNTADDNCFDLFFTATK